MSKAKSKAPAIYPFYLSEHAAVRLLNPHQREFEEENRYRSSSTEFSYSATVYENGDVNLFVSYRYDDGYVAGSGKAFEKTIRPFSEEELANLKERRMFSLAEEEYFRRQEEKQRQAIKKIQAEMFGPKPRVRSSKPSK